jgi:hypothetical protein
MFFVRAEPLRVQTLRQLVDENDRCIDVIWAPEGAAY